MDYKKIIILTLFLSLLLIGSASAADVSNDTQTDINQIDESSADILKIENSDESQDMNSINEVETNTELTDNTNETLTASEITVNDYNELYDQIENLMEQGTSESYTINLNPNGDFAITDAIKLQGNNSPAKEFIINGNGATIDGKNSKYFLTIFENYKVTLNDLNFVDNIITKDGGGAIAAHTGSELNINNCNFTGCKAANETESIHAGAIRMGFDAILRINNSIFKRNSATYGAGAIVIGGTLTEYNTRPHPDLDPTTITPTSFINNCQFIDNTAGHGGAINIEDFCSAIIINCTFNGNSATDSEFGLGGAICSDRSTYAVLINNTFKDNTAKQSGGAICTDETACLLSVNNTFQNNIAENSGGGLYNALKSQIKIENTIFIKNEATFGSAVCNHDSTTLTVTGSTFNENKATDLGGAICTGKNNILTINNTEFNKNQGKLGGAICLSANSKMNIDATTFTQNNAEDGGAIHGAKDNKIIMKNIKLTDNTATTNGGAITTGENNHLTINNTTFTANKANLGGAILSSVDSEAILDDSIFTQNSAENGGAIYAAKNNNIQITNTEITENTATTIGGAITTGENNFLTINNTEFIKNQGKLGGAICLSANSIMNASTITFSQNSAENGGVIYGTKNNNMLLKNIKLTDNIATTNGGAIITGENTVIALTNATFDANKAKLGGAILGSINSYLLLEDAIFTQNSAENGGAIYTAKNNNIQIKNAEITDNAATAIGGAILTGENNTLILTNTILNANSANLGGAILGGTNSRITTNGASFTQNIANSNGGAIVTGENNTLVLTNTILDANSANLGGAILGGINSRITANGASFTQNIANSNGGAIRTGENNILSLTNTTFETNKANLGGAICLSANSEITADKTTFAQNNATKSGGAIYSTNDNKILMTNAELTDNVATTTGGAIFTGKTTTLTASNTKFNKNSAGSLGGAICGESGSSIILANSKFSDNAANIGNALFNPKEATLILKGNTSIDSGDYVNNGELKIEDTLNTKISIDSIDYSSGIVVEGKLVDEYNCPIADETVSVSVENENVQATTDSNGKYLARFANMNPGTYTITSTYPGNSAYGKSTTNITKKVVDRQPSRIAVTDITTTYNSEEYLVITLVNNQNSQLPGMQININFGAGAKAYTTDSNGQVKIPTKDLSAKTYVADIIFEGSENYLPSNATAKITINKQKTQITSADVTTTYSINKDFVVTLKNEQNSPLTNTPITMDFGEGAESYTTDGNGQVKISTNSLDTDTYDVKIAYNGDENYEQTNATAKITINKQKTQITSTDVTTIYNKNKDIIVTLKNEQNAVLSDEMIIVTIKTSIKQYTTDSNGQIKIPTASLIPDTYEAKITYNGNENYGQSSTTSQIIVNKDTTKITIAYTNNELAFTFTNSQNSPLTSMPLSINLGKGYKAYTTDNNGQVKISTEGIQGTYTITAKYNGNEKYLPTNTTATMTVTPKSTTVTLVDSVNSYTYSENVIIKVKTDTDGTLTVKVGDTPQTKQAMAGNIISFNFGILNVNNYDVTISLDAGNNYVPYQNTTSITITPKSTSITLNAKDYDTTEKVIINVTASENGKVTMRLGSITKTIDINANALTSVDFGILNIGSYAIDANFTAGNNYIDSGATGNVKVLSKIKDEDVNITISEIKANQENDIVINLPADATGTVTLTIDNNGYTFTVTDGVADIKVPKLDGGNYNYVITYSGDSKYSSFTKTANITVNNIISTTITASSVTTVYNGGKYLVATLKDKDGNPMKYVKVSVKFSNGKTDTQTTNKYGQVQFSTNGLAPVKKYYATINFDGNTKYEQSTTTVKVKVYKATPKIIAKAQKFKRSDKKKQYTIRLLTNQNIKMKYTKVYIKVNGKVYAAQTNKKGYATFSLKKLTKKGTYKAKIMYYGDAFYNPLTTKVKIAVK